MQPTKLAVASMNVVVTFSTANSSYVIYPRLGVPIMSSVTQSPPYTYTAFASPNGAFPQTAQIQAEANGGRVIAMGIKVISMASDNSNQGLIRIGLTSRDPDNPGSNDTTNGLPLVPSTTSTQGFNEFMSYDQCDSFPLRLGSRCVWKPQDPLDFTFRSSGVITDANTGAGSTNEEQSSPCFTVGMIGTATSSSQVTFEMVLHLEYTQGPFTTSAGAAQVGTMTLDQAQGSVYQTFRGLTNLARMGVDGAVNAAYRGGTRLAYGAGAAVANNLVRNIRNRLGNWASNGVNSQRWNQGMLMELD